MKAPSARLALLFSCLGHAYLHLFNACSIVIALLVSASAVERQSGAFTQLNLIPVVVAGVAALITCFLLSARPPGRMAVPAEQVHDKRSPVFL